MALRLENDSHYIGKEGNTDWWEWTAYIKPDNMSELESIDHVEYKLHPTFKNPVKWIKKKEGGFPLKMEGWGTFKLKAKIFYRDKTKPPLKLEHELKFEGSY